MMSDQSLEITNRFRVGDFVRVAQHGWCRIVSLPRFGLACEELKGPNAAEVECVFEDYVKRCISAYAIEWSVDRQIAAIFYSRVREGLYSRNHMPPSDELCNRMALRLLNEGRLGLIKNEFYAAIG